MKVAIIQGKFDPFTVNDLKLALAYRKEKHYDKVLFEVLNGENYQDRLNIVKLSIKPYRKLGIRLNENGDIIKDKNFDLGLTKPNFLEISNRAIDYVIDRALYVEEIAKKTLSEYRFNHVKCVAKLAADTCVKYGYKYNEGLVSGYLHDITKEWDKQFHYDFMKSYRNDKLEVSPKIYHQYSGEIIAKRDFKIKNRNITSAIGNHVNGTDRKILSKIIFCADKNDDSRGFDNTEIKQLMLDDINKAYKQVKEEQIRYLKESKQVE